MSLTWLIPMLVGVVAEATPTKKIAPAATKMACTIKALDHKDCWLQLGGNKIHVWHDKIFLNDTIERDAKPLPVQGENVSWEFIRGAHFNNRWFIEVALWGGPQSQGDVESLIWTVFEIRAGLLEQKTQQVVQKRKKISAIGEQKGLRLQYDKRKPFKLFAKNKKVYWQADKQQGVIE